MHIPRPLTSRKALAKSFRKRDAVLERTNQHMIIVQCRLFHRKQHTHLPLAGQQNTVNEKIGLFLR